MLFALQSSSDTSAGQSQAAAYSAVTPAAIPPPYVS